MLVFTCTNFTGHYPVGTAAVVTADSAEQAATLLRGELARIGLDQPIEPEDMILLRTGTRKVRVLADGNY